MKHTIFLFAAIFSMGYLFNDLVGKILKPAHADVAGMDYYDLKYDWDFERAVESIIEDCTVDGKYISC